MQSFMGLLVPGHQWRNVSVCLLDLLYGVTEIRLSVLKSDSQSSSQTV